MPSSRHLIAAWIALCALSAADALAWTVTPRNSIAINTAAVPAMSELSGAAYHGSLGDASHELYAVQDSGNQLVTISFGVAANGSLTSAAATATRTLSPGFDFEGVALGPSDSVLVAEETTPTIRRYDVATGAAVTALAMPGVFANSRPNFAFESLTRAPDGLTYWTGNEAALTTDGPIANTTQGTTVRLQRFTYGSAGTQTLGPQYAYQVDPIHSGTTVDANTRSGLVDLVALPDSSILALERSLGNGFPFYEDRIYRVTFAGATDISQPPFAAGLIGRSYTPATKSLLWKGQAGGGFGQNMEGLTLGPQLPGGDWALLGVVDNGDPLSSNTLVSFSLSPTVPGDFNGNGAVDAADYIIWRKSLGTTFVAADYETWRTHFSQSAGSGATLGSLGTVPEPNPLSLIICILAATAIRPTYPSRPV